MASIKQEIEADDTWMSYWSNPKLHVEGVEDKKPIISCEIKGEIPSDSDCSSVSLEEDLQQDRVESP